ncbi:MAG: L-seryl-tRNA(Sec) selenium transferase [Gammaproteobacteria bacterium]|nr:L-seryl-tRNA(Sec) selenium transferase [Gammaproteobacteria bacterium]
MAIQLPSVHEVLYDPSMDELRDQYGLNALTEAIRTIQDSQRVSVKSKTMMSTPTPQDYVSLVSSWLASNRSGGYRRVFNLTGIVLHSNLGRAPISPTAIEKVSAIVSNPSTLEFNRQTGKRGHRDDVVKERLCHLIGCESATFVNNNAAALLLVVNTFAKGKSAIVSRSELIEIGGSFRLPEIIESSGCKLVEVGTTNRTHLRDYANAISSNVGLILKVHQSNFRIEGFTNEVDTPSLAELAQQSNLPLAVDLGSGALTNLDQFGLPNEPQPQHVLEQGADLVTVSGDKLLGGPQAGIVVGSRKYVDELNRNPLKRALRLDKLTLGLLDQTLKTYENPDDINKQIPLYRTLSTPTRQLKHRANMVRSRLAEVLPENNISIEASKCQLGSGSLPEQSLDSICVSISASTESPLMGLSERFRALSIPIISRIHKGAIKLDMLTAEDLDQLLETLGELN